jgi:hypothetical protein
LTAVTQQGKMATRFTLFNNWQSPLANSIERCAMTKQQVIWANNHDWFRGWKDLGDGEYEVTACTEPVRKDGSIDIEILITKSFRELRDWAGY